MSDGGGSRDSGDFSGLIRRNTSHSKGRENPNASVGFDDFSD